MMKYHKILVGTLLAVAALGTVRLDGRNLNSAEAPGYIARGRAMLSDLTCLGTQQQSEEALRLPHTPSEQEEAEYLCALASLHRGETRAKTLLEEWIRNYPESPRRWNAKLALGDYYFGRKEYADARLVYYSFSPNLVDGALEEDRLYRLAYCNLLLGYDKEAKTTFERLANTGTTAYRTAANFYLGYIAYQEGDYNTATSLLEQVARQADPELTPAARMYLSQIYFKQGKFERALDESRKVLASGASSFYPEANRISGESLYNLGKTSEAIPLLWMYADAVENPAPSALYILGTDEYLKGEYKNAISLLRRVVSTEESRQAENGAMNQSAWLFLGQAYAASGKTDNALMAFDTARRGEYDPSVAETAFYNYAVATIDGGRVPFGSSVRTLEEFLSKYPDSSYAPQVEEYIISGYLADNNYSGALASIDRIKNPSNRIKAARQNVVFALGTREYAEGNFAQALPRFKQAASQTSAPYSRSIAQQAELWKGMTLYELGRYKEASTAFQTYLRNASGSDNRALAQYDLGYSEYQQENFKAAYSAFAKAAAETKAGTDTERLADTYCRMGDCQYYESNFAEAAADYQRAYELNPSSGDYALYQNAVMKGLQRDNAGKIAALDNFMTLFPTSALVADALLEKAETQVATGNNNGALETYRQLTESYPTTATGRKGYLQMAITLMSEGRNGESEQAYKEIISTYPTSEEARLATEDLKRYYAAHGGLDSFAEWMSRIANAPQLNPSEMDDLTFDAAEREYVSKDTTTKLVSYLDRYPTGAHRAKALYYLAEAASLSGDQQNAHKYASELLAKHPDADSVEDALLIKADAETSNGRIEEAFATFSQLETRAVSATHLYEARLGQLRTASELGNAEAAIAAADKLLASTAAGTESTAEIRSLRAEALDQAGRSSEAEEEWSRILNTGGQNDAYSSKATVMMSNSLLKRGETERAHKMIDDFINSNPPQQYWLARAFIVLSDVLRAEGDDFEADQYLQSLKTNYPGNEADITRMIDERLK